MLARLGLYAPLNVLLEVVIESGSGRTANTFQRVMEGSLGKEGKKVSISDALRGRQIDTTTQIIEQKQKIKGYEAIIEGIRASITQLELLRSDLDDDLVELLSALGPWRPSRLPFEVLCQLFTSTSAGDYYIASPPWTLMAVRRA